MPITKMKCHGFKILGAALLPLMLAGCWHTPQMPSLKYDIRPEIFAEGPPRPVGAGIKSSDRGTSHTQVKIDPRASAGYGEIPNDLKTLYSGTPRDITQNDVIHQTLAHNRDIKIQNYVLQVAEAQVPLSKGIYDLMLQASAQALVDSTNSTLVDNASSGLPAGTIPLAGVHRQQAVSAGATQLLPTGARAQFAYAYERINENNQFPFNPVISHGLTLSVTQPLLRGFGPTITNINITLAEYDRKISAADFEALVQTQLRTALDAYWNLVFAVHDFDVQVISYEAALDLLRINRAKVAAGVMAPTEVLQAQAQAEARRQFIITARQQVQNAEDRLKQLMFFKDEEPDWELEIRPAQELNWRELDVDPAKTLLEALENRPEIRSSKSRLDRSAWEIIRAHDLLKPDLNLSASGRVNGVGNTHGDAFNTMGDGDANSRSIGLDFGFPLQNRQARYNLLQRQIDQNRSLEEFLKAKDDVTLDVRLSIRSLKTSREQIDITRSRVESEEANLDAQKKRYEVGVSTAFEVLQFQTNLANAQEAHIQAVVDYNRSMIALERARGTILQTYGIGVQSPSLDPPIEKVVFPVGLN